jgi:hypothetical protein
MERALFPGRRRAGSIWTRVGGRLRARRTAAVACATCGSSLTCPREWSMAGEHHWLVDFRCGECGAWMAVVLTNAQAARLECLLARQVDEIRRAADRERRPAPAQS